MAGTEVLLAARRLPDGAGGGMEAWSRHVHHLLIGPYACRDAGTASPSMTGQMAGVARLGRQARRWTPTSRPMAVDASDAVMLLSGVGRHAPTVCRVHGLDLLWRNPIYQTLLRRRLGDAAAYVANSRPTAALLSARGIPEEQIHVIHPPAIVPDTRPPRCPAPAQFVMLGRLVARKGVAPFIRDLWPRIRAACPDATLDVIGDGPARQAVHAAAADAAGVTVHGRLASSDVEQFLARATALIMNNEARPGDFEGFGMVAAESAIRGVPVLARAVDGVVDAVRHGETGRLIPPGTAGDAALVAAALAAADGQWGDGNDVAAAATARYGVERHDAAYLALMRELTAGSARHHQANSAAQ